MLQKITIFVTLLTLAVASPSPHLHGHHHHHGKGIVLGKGHHHRRYSYKGNKILGCFGYFARGINRQCGRSYSIFNELSSYRDVGDFEGSISLLNGVCKGGSDIINFQWPGLGDIFQNLIACSHRILFCVPSLWRRKNKCGVCDKDYGKHWGWRRYEGKYDHINDVIVQYDLYGSKSRVEKILNDCTEGRGIEGLTGTQKIVAKYIWDLSCLFDHDYNWRSDDFHKIFHKLTGIIAALGNSRRMGLGDYIIDGLVKYCGRSIKEYGYPDVSSSVQEIKKEIESSSLDSFRKAIACSDGTNEPEFDTDENNNSNENYNNNNTNGHDNQNYNNNANGNVNKDINSNVSTDTNSNESKNINELKNNNDVNSSTKNNNVNDVVINNNVYYIVGSKDSADDRKKETNDVEEKENESTVDKKEKSVNKKESVANKKQSSVNKQVSSVDTEESSANKEESCVDKQNTSIDKQKSTNKYQQEADDSDE